MRRTENPQELAFVLDNDMLLTPTEQDENGNGTIEPEEDISEPGEPYDITGVPLMGTTVFEQPASDDAITYDKWGTWISAYAPIRNGSGSAVAILGIDMRADQFLVMTGSILSPTRLALILLGVTLVAGSFLIFFWRRRLRLLQRLDAQRIALVTIASHKLGGPIATIRWWVEALSDGTAANRKQSDEARTELQNAVERLSDVTQHLDDATTMDGTDLDLWQHLAEETKREIDARKTP
ncbi:hypothetical protein EXS70_05150 [Candidatus Peribacteria bacterium]|nr:hypothetical protein [Candidatus Peribacteria bacterium]